MVEKMSSLQRGVLRAEGRSHTMSADLRGVLYMRPSNLSGENTPLSPSGGGLGFRGVKVEQEVWAVAMRFGETMSNRGESEIGSRSMSAKNSFTGDRKDVLSRSRLISGDAPTSSRDPPWAGFL